MEGECSKHWATAANGYCTKTVKRLFQCTVLPYDFAIPFLFFKIGLVFNAGCQEIFKRWMEGAFNGRKYSKNPNDLECKREKAHKQLRLQL